VECDLKALEPTRDTATSSALWGLRSSFVQPLAVGALFTGRTAVSGAAAPKLTAAASAARRETFAAVEVEREPSEWLCRGRDARFLEQLADEVGGDQCQCRLVSRMRRRLPGSDPLDRARIEPASFDQD
jgi:hypothetical protein